jgi:flagellar basal-body rod modification protein FlgD
MATTAINPLGPATAASGGSANNASSANSAATAAANSNISNENTFLQLMIAELENQDPENPTDGTEFVTQLAEFSAVQSETQSASDLNSILQIMQQGGNLADPAGGTSPQTGTAGTNGTSATTGS